MNLINGFHKTTLYTRIMSIVKQFAKFGVVGASNTVISILIYNGLLYFNVHYILAYTIAFIISVINAYIWNKKYVFRTTSTKNGKTFAKVFVSYGCTFLLGMELLFLMVRYFAISKSLAQILLLSVTIPANFLLNKLWAFNEKI